MNTKNKVSIAAFSALSILSLFLISYGSTQAATNVLLGRYNHEYMGEINIFTLIGIVLLPASLLLLGVWVFTSPKKANNESKSQPKWWRSYWIGLVIVTIVVGVLSPILFKTSWTNSIWYMAIALVAEGIAFYGRAKQSLKLNRIMYVLLGAPIGFALWLISIVFIERTFYPQAANDSVFFIGSMLACFGIGALIGDFIGKLRNYRGPAPYQP